MTAESSDMCIIGGADKIQNNSTIIDSTLRKTEITKYILKHVCHRLIYCSHAMIRVDALLSI